MKRNFILLLLVVFVVNQLFSQSKSDFNKQRKHLFNQLNFAEDLLNETDFINYNSLVKLNIIKNKITYRRAIVETFNKEISYIDKKINALKFQQDSLDLELDKIKKEYEQLIYYAYKNKSVYDKLMFILSAETFTQAYKRLKYLEQYTSYRKNQVDYIRFKKLEIQKNITELEEKKVRKIYLIDERLKEQEYLAKEKVKEEKVVKKIQENFPDLEIKLDSTANKSNLLESSVGGLISSLNDLTLSASKTADMESAESIKIISENFKTRKGKLLSPVAKGLVVSSFGNHEHPQFPNLKIRNDGIDILTVNGSIVKSIFTGKVVKIIDIPGLNKSILIRHGDYYSLYSNIIDVNVTEGEKVVEGQEIGIIFTDKFEENSSILKFQIWYKKEKLNPEQWLGEI